ncbi:hypothetical protein V8C44DRAFT_57372 [Trichoderma aethiopicum]
MISIVLCLLYAGNILALYTVSSSFNHAPLFSANLWAWAKTLATRRPCVQQKGYIASIYVSMRYARYRACTATGHLLIGHAVSWQKRYHSPDPALGASTWQRGPEGYSSRLPRFGKMGKP